LPARAGPLLCASTPTPAAPATAAARRRTTFVGPAEAFPTAARATCHGISAASGKIGAALGAAAMAPLLTAYGSDDAGKNKGLQVVLAICAALGALGAAWTWIFTAETRDIPVGLAAVADAEDSELAGKKTWGK